MNEIKSFCKENGISASLSYDSFYFTLNGKNYRVSNHTVKASNERAYNDFGEKIRDIYHGAEDDFICITASKTRIKEIYEALKSGVKLDKRGCIKEKNVKI